MSQYTSLCRHQSYNNRFRTSVTSADGSQGPPQSPLNSVSESVDLFGQSTDFGRLSFKTPVSGEQNGTGTPDLVRTVNLSSSERAAPMPAVAEASSGHHPRDGNSVSTGGRQSVGDTSRPTAPGKPRRLSRKTSAGTRRQQFAAYRTSSRDGGQQTSADSACDDVFVEVGAGGEEGAQQQQQQQLYDTSLFPKGREQLFSTTSTALSNPYNRLNHKLHDMLWCCQCVYFVFFCCLPAIHYMERSDVEFGANNQKEARRAGRLSTLLFGTGTLLTLLVFAFIFFLAIYFTS